MSQVRHGFSLILRRAWEEGAWAAVIGHSAGGHLAAMLMLTDWKQYGIDDRCLATVFRGQ